LKIGGGKERMASLFNDSAFLAVYQPPQSAEARKDLIAFWHKRKSEIYREIIASGKIPSRSGVKRLTQEALHEDWVLAVASTSAEESVRSVLNHSMGEEIANRFSLVLAGDVVKAKKPAPDIYEMVAQKLNVSAEGCVVIEDSRNGLLAAAGARMRCVITVSTYTREEDFAEAAIVLSCLGDPGGERCEVLENRSKAEPNDYLTAEDLDEILKG